MRFPKTLLVLGAVALAVLLGATAGPNFFPTLASADSPEDTAWLGVGLQDLNANLRDAMGFERRQRGALVTSVVSGSPADDAGLRARDLITHLNGKRIRATDNLIDLVDDMQPGDEIEISILRGDRERTLNATLGARPARSAAPDVREHFLPEDEDDDDGGRTWTWGSDNDDDRDRRVWVFGDDDSDSESDSASESDASVSEDSDSDSDSRVNRWFSRGNDDDDDDSDTGFRWFSRDDEDSDRNRDRVIVRGHSRSRGYLGVRTQALSEQLAEYFQTEAGEGVLITEVGDDTPAADAGLRAGDVILAVENDEIGSPGELRRAIRRHDPEDSVNIRVLRRGDRRTLKVTLGDTRDVGELNELLPDLRGMAPEGVRLHVLEGLEGLHELEDLKELHLEGLEGLRGLKGLRGLEALEGLKELRLDGLEGLKGLHLEGLEGLHDLEGLKLYIPKGDIHIEELDGLHEHLDGMHEQLRKRFHELHKKHQDRKVRMRSPGVRTRGETATI